MFTEYPFLCISVDLVSKQHVCLFIAQIRANRLLVYRLVVMLLFVCTVSEHADFMKHFSVRFNFLFQ